MSFGPRYRLLDSWRGFACVAVTLHHSGFLIRRPEVIEPDETWRLGARRFSEQLDLGVPLFFVISGYCIAASLSAHRDQGASAWRFLARRAWRIYPPYWAAVAVFGAVVGGLGWVGWAPIRTGTHALHLDQPGDLSWSQ